MMRLRLHSINGSLRQKLKRWVIIMVVISQSEFIVRQFAFKGGVQAKF